MAKKVYAKRFAQAIFEIALEKKELDKWQSDLGKVAILGQDDTLIGLLQDPRLHFDSKAKLLSEQLGDINSLALNLVYLLIAKGKLNMIGDIADEYQRLLNSYRGIEQAEVATVIPLDDENKQRLAEYLGKAVGKKVVLKPEVDSRLVGGIVARVGDKLLDGSTRSKLAALKGELAKAR